MAPMLYSILFSLLLAIPAIAQDLEGSADHALVGRFEGSNIVDYEYEDYGEFKFTTGKKEGERDPHGETFEGAITKIAYLAPAGSSTVQILRGFEQSLEENGFITVFSCKNTDRDRTDWCGPKTTPSGYWLHTNLHKFEEIRLFYAVKEDETEDIRVQVTAAKLRDNDLAYSVVVVENKDFENKIIDADAVTNELTAQGKMAFYDIHFETGSAQLTDDSAPTIALIAEVLEQSPELNIVIVGHTDNEGSLDYNIDLSRARAEVVAQLLSQNHGIDAGRINHAGVAFLAPVTTNANEEGRALNRRVEVVVR